MLPESGAGLLPGLAVGDTRAVSIELNDEMRTSGLSHLTAVSGEIVRFRDGSRQRDGHRTPSPQTRCDVLRYNPIIRAFIAAARSAASHGS